MLSTAPTRLARLPGLTWRGMAALAHLADAHLAVEATRNAAAVLEAARSGRRLEEARALRDLRRLGFGDGTAETASG